MIGLSKLCVLLLWASAPQLQTARPETPELFSPDVISSPAPEFAISFSRDGNTVYFNRASPDRSRIQLLFSEKKNGVWQDAKPVSFSAEAGVDVDPFVSVDGKHLYFSSNRPKPGMPGPADFDTWYVTRTETGWGDPRLIAPPVNSTATEVFVSVDREGTVYFASDRHTGFDMAIFEAKKTDNDYAVPVIVLFEGRTVPASNPCVSPDGKFMIFSADLNIGKGGTDLYVSFKGESGWRFPVSVPGVNTAAAEFAPAIGPEGKYLYFTSERPRPGKTLPKDGSRPPGDIYRIRLSTIHGLVP